MQPLPSQEQNCTSDLDTENYSGVTNNVVGSTQTHSDNAFEGCTTHNGDMVEIHNAGLDIDLWGLTEEPSNYPDWDLWGFSESSNGLNLNPDWDLWEALNASDPIITAPVL